MKKRVLSCVLAFLLFVLPCSFVLQEPVRATANAEVVDYNERVQVLDLPFSRFMIDNAGDFVFSYGIPYLVYEPYRRQVSVLDISLQGDVVNVFGNCPLSVGNITSVELEFAFIMTEDKSMVFDIPCVMWVQFYGFTQTYISSYEAMAVYDAPYYSTIYDFYDTNENNIMTVHLQYDTRYYQNEYVYFTDGYYVVDGGGYGVTGALCRWLPYNPYWDFGNGYNDGYDSGYANGQYNGYQQGFQAGVESVLDGNNEYTFMGLISAVVDAPVKALAGLFNFNVLGIDMFPFLTAILTMCIIIAVVKMVM